jgi:hypothetical protein
LLENIEFSKEIITSNQEKKLFMSILAVLYLDMVAHVGGVHGLVAAS